MKRTIIEKIWDEHVVSQQQGHPAILAIDLHLIHEVTSAQAFQVLRQEGLPVFEPERCVATLDHSIPTRRDRELIHDEMARKQVETLRRNAQEFGVPLFDMGSGNQGIVHVIGPEMGLTHPGMTIVCGDSHTSTHGAFGALAFGIGTSEVGHVLATGCILQQKPRTMKVEFRGQRVHGVFAKDMILALIARIGVDGANGHVIEYSGEAGRALSMEGRMTICNMSIECGARAGLFGPDEKTFEYIKGRCFAPAEADFGRAVSYWKSLCSDEGAVYDREVVIEAGELSPMVTWGTNPEQGIGISERIPLVKDLPEASQEVARKALEYTGLKEGEKIEGTPVDWAFLGSCTNARIDDLRIGAEMIKGKKVHDGLHFFVVPGSEQVRAQAIKEGLDRIFIQAGADFRMPGCSMCLGMNDDKVPAGKRCISSSNRNFVGRQGTGSRTHLASPATVVASAIEGKITDPRKYL